MKELNEQQTVFCEEYLKGFLLGGKGINATEAYMKAYPDSTRVSAGANAARLLDNDNVKAYLKERMSSLVMSTNEVLIRLADIARNAEKDVDKIRALELTGKALALFLDRTDITSQGESISLAQYLNGVNAATKKNRVKLPNDITVLETDGSSN